VLGEGNVLPFLSEGELPEHMRGLKAEKAPEKKPAVSSSSSSSSSASPSPAQSTGHAPAPPTGPSPMASQEMRFPDAVVQSLIDMGFPREKCIAALRRARGDPNTAINILLSE
jgi:hypothetical protein